MGFQKPMNFNNIHSQISKAGYELNNFYNDGFVQFEIKKDLYRIKWLVDDILKGASTFVGEDEFLKEHDEEEIIKKLKNLYR